MAMTYGSNIPERGKEGDTWRTEGEAVMLSGNWGRGSRRSGEWEVVIKKFLHQGKIIKHNIEHPSYKESPPERC